MLFEKLLPTAEEVVACFPNAMHRRRGYKETGLESRINCNHNDPDHFFLWLCDGVYEEGDDGIHYLGGKRLYCTAAEMMAAHAGGRDMALIAQVNNPGQVSAARVFAVDIATQPHATLLNRSSIPVNEYRDLIRCVLCTTTCRQGKPYHLKYILPSILMWTFVATSSSIQHNPL